MVKDSALKLQKFDIIIKRADVVFTYKKQLPEPLISKELSKLLIKAPTSISN